MSTGDVGCFGASADLIVRGRVHAKRDVVADAIAEQKCLLRHEADVSAQRLQRVFADRAAVDQNHAGFGVIDAGNQIDQRGLARTCRPDDGEAASCGNAQVHVVQHLLAFIAEVQLRGIRSHLDVAVLRAGSILNLGLLRA